MKKDISRRDFLKAAAVGAVGVSAFGLLSACGKTEQGSSAAIYTPGTYTATAKGMGDVTVTMTFDESSITDVQLDLSGETEGIGQAAKDTLIAQILDGQTVVIDGVSGATVTSKAVMQAAADCIAQAGGNAVLVTPPPADAPEASVDWLGAEPEIADSEIVKTYDYDLVVVAPVQPAPLRPVPLWTRRQDGRHREMNESFYGDGIRDTMAAIGSRQQLANGDNPDKFDVITMMYQHSNGYGDQRLYKIWAENSGEAVDWYTDRMAEHGFKVMHEVESHDREVRYKFYDVGHSFQWGAASESGVEYDMKYTAQVLFGDYAGKGLDVHHETTLVKLIKADGKVTGLIASTAEGYVRYNASRGVVVCTGGYSSNEDMLKALQPETVRMKAVNYSFPGVSGDGIKACLWAGGMMDANHASMLFDRSAIKPDATGTQDASLFWMGSQPFLKVDLSGKRFTNESGCYDHILHDAFNLPSMTYCTVWDAGYADDGARFATHGCSRLIGYDNGAEAVMPFFIVEGMNADLLANGYIVQADTVEALAEKLNIPADSFRETIDRYNELYDKQDDEDFGKESYRLSQMRTAPFYGCRCCGGYFLCTMDGIKINTDMNVISEDGTVIEGLYASGDCSGGYFGNSYVNLLAGAAAGRSVTFGRLAGKNAAHRAV
jgi:uncharacterized protein with FMN-binding domain